MGRWSAPINMHLPPGLTFPGLLENHPTLPSITLGATRLTHERHIAQLDQSEYFIPLATVVGSGMAM